MSLYNLKKFFSVLIRSFHNLFITKSILRKKIFNIATPESYHRDWFVLERKKLLILCHDQKIDPRIIEQSISLDKIGIKILIVCLSQDAEDALEIYKGVFIHRVGKKKILPDCSIFWQYQRIKLFTSALEYIFPKFCQKLERLNYFLYEARCKFSYSNNNNLYPLPFDECLYRAGYLYKTDAIIAYTLPSLTAATRIASKRKIPLIYCLSQLYSEQKNFSHYQKKLLNKVEAKNIKKCAKVFVKNEQLAIKLEQKYKIKPCIILNLNSFLIAFKELYGLNDITNLATVVNSTLPIKGFEFENILWEDPDKFYAAADMSEKLPHYIIFDFSKYIKLKKIQIIWESNINHGSNYSFEYFDEITKSFINLVECNKALGKNHSLNINKDVYFSKLRLIVYKTTGQKRLLIRGIRLFGDSLS